MKMTKMRPIGLECGSIGQTTQVSAILHQNAHDTRIILEARVYLGTTAKKTVLYAWERKIPSVRGLEREQEEIEIKWGVNSGMQRARVMRWKKSAPGSKGRPVPKRKVSLFFFGCARLA